jgi:HAD superfamily hydrolase (TIGR01509 family)
VPLRAIVFDFDGVIANSEPLHYLGFRDVLDAESVALTEDVYYAELLGYDDVGVFRAVAATHGRPWTPAKIASLVERKAQRLEQLEREVSVLFPGAADAIRRAASVVPVAIASGALGAEIRRVVDREQLTPLFTAIVAAEDTPRSKPSPDPYLRALALLSASAGADLRAADCLAIEDSHWGLESARAAGLRTVGVATTYRADTLEADLTIPSLSALDVTVLQRLFSD